jgi:hypothetical protein
MIELHESFENLMFESWWTLLIRLVFSQVILDENAFLHLFEADFVLQTGLLYLCTEKW